MQQDLNLHNSTAIKTHKSFAVSGRDDTDREIFRSPEEITWKRLVTASAQVTAVSCSCAAYIQPVPPARGTGCRRWPAARGCNVCGGGRLPWSRDPDTNPRTTRRTPHSLVVLLCEKKGEKCVKDDINVSKREVISQY